MRSSFQPSSRRFQFRALTLCSLLVLIGFCFTSAEGKDWPQINGPSRNGVASNETLLTKWPAGGLKPIWTHPVGQGFSGPAVFENTVVIFHRPGQANLCEARDAKTGKLKWSKELPSEYQGGGPDGDRGPKCVPLIHDQNVYLLGTGGNLFCLALADGSIVWKTNVQKTYQSPSGYFGTGSTPVVVDGKLLVNVGGKDAAVVAFDLKTGKEVWKSFDDRASYSSPVEMTIGGQKAVVFITRFHVIGLRPNDGSLVFKTPFGVRGPSVNGAMPVVLGSQIFVNSAYGVGAKLLKVDSKLEIAWENDESFSSQYSTPVLFGGRLFGTAGREDFRNGSFRCLDPLSGKVVWQKNGIPVGHTILVKDQIILLDSKGKIHIIKADKERFNETFTASLFASGSRSMPALSNGRLFARSNARGDVAEFSCFLVGKSN